MSVSACLCVWRGVIAAAPFADFYVVCVCEVRDGLCVALRKCRQQAALEEAGSLVCLTSQVCWFAAVWQRAVCPALPFKPFIFSSS